MTEQRDKRQCGWGSKRLHMGKRDHFDPSAKRKPIKSLRLTCYILVFSTLQIFLICIFLC